MAILKGLVTQSGADTQTSFAIDTSLTVDGKVGWQINRVVMYWDNGEVVAAADYEVKGILTTVNATTVMSSSDEICRCSWSCANTGGVAIAFTQDLIKESILLAPRLTVQPILYFLASSTLSGNANIIYFQIQYEIVKLTDIELLRLLVGGA